MLLILLTTGCKGGLLRRIILYPFSGRGSKGCKFRRAAELIRAGAGSSPQDKGSPFSGRIPPSAITGAACPRARWPGLCLGIPLAPWRDRGGTSALPGTAPSRVAAPGRRAGGTGPTSPLELQHLDEGVLFFWLFLFHFSFLFSHRPRPPRFK